MQYNFATCKLKFHLIDNFSNFNFFFKLFVLEIVPRLQRNKVVQSQNKKQKK